MKLFPAIDIKDGQCVRLYQGDYDQMTVYASDPVEVAQRWQEAGASWLHVVDLDGAKEGHPLNTDLIARICQQTTLRVEVGGGLRSLEHIEKTLAAGIERVILGTAVLTDRALLDQALRRWGERIVVGLDARAGLVAISGWRGTSNVRATELARELSAAGINRFIYTDIARDAAMQGPNLAALSSMLDALQGTSTTLIASGGVSSLEDLRQLARLEVEGAIIGKALYVGAINLAEAVRVIEGEQTGGKAC
jgi:phosphoribosylformimino-5-aminoimidazole carboxamide ribotide isomerase